MGNVPGSVWVFARRGKRSCTCAGMPRIAMAHYLNMAASVNWNLYEGTTALVRNL